MGCGEISFFPGGGVFFIWLLVCCSVYLDSLVVDYCILDSSVSREVLLEGLWYHQDNSDPWVYIFFFPLFSLFLIFGMSRRLLESSSGTVPHMLGCMYSTVLRSLDGRRSYIIKPGSSVSKLK